MTVVVEAINEAERSADEWRAARRRLAELNERLDPRIADLEQVILSCVACLVCVQLTVL